MLTILPVWTVILALALIKVPQLFTCSALMVPSSAISNIHPSKTVSLRAIREATFGMGCFWKPAESLKKVDGVLDTMVGYAGGSLGGSKPLQPPTYDDVCYGDSWVESVMVAFDDEVVSYESLLDRFWEVQEPREGGERQYRSIIFPSDEIQYETSQEWLRVAREEEWKRKSDGLPISIVDIDYGINEGGCLSSEKSDGVMFYRAEEYHQKFWQKWRVRIAVAVFLVSMSVDLSIVHASTEFQSQYKLCTTVILAAAGLYYIGIERIIDDSVKEILPGEFAGLAAVRARKSTKDESK